MAAGLGFKTFVSGDVLTAADTNGYLMQGVWVFANAAARTAAVTSPQEGNASFLKDTNALEIYDGASWVAYGSGDLTEISAGVGITVTNGTGPIPTITNSSTDLITTAGDILYGTAADTVARLGIGTAGQVLKVNSGATAPEWVAASATKSFSLLGSASLSSTITTVSGLSGYDDFLVLVEQATLTSGNGDLRWRINGNTGSVYTQAGSNFNGASAYAASINGSTNRWASTACDAGTANSTTGGYVVLALSIRGANSSGLKILAGNSGNIDGGGSGSNNRNWQGFFNDTAVVSSISLVTLSSTFSAGTIYVYGAI